MLEISTCLDLWSVTVFVLTPGINYVLHVFRTCLISKPLMATNHGTLQFGRWLSCRCLGGGIPQFQYSSPQEASLLGWLGLIWAPRLQFPIDTTFLPITLVARWFRILTSPIPPGERRKYQWIPQLQDMFSSKRPARSSHQGWSASDLLLSFYVRNFCE